jgi:ParB/RepB/Spo0J family partition protein
MTLADNPTADAAAPATATADAAAPVRAPVKYAYETIVRALVVPSLTNPRTRFDVEHLAEMAETMRTHGILQPLLVRRLPAARLQETFTDRRSGAPRPTHEIVAGERRYRASELAGLTELPVLVRELDDAQVLRMQVIENVERESLHPLEEAAGYRRILDLPDQAQLSMEERIDALAKSVKKSTRYIYQTLQLLKLCDFAQKVFYEDKVQRTTAVQIASIGNEAQQIEATRVIAGLSRAGKLSTDVIENPKSHREATSYIAANFRLVLSKAPFPVKVEYAGVGACTTCSKMSANAVDLFDDGSKVPDTCMDPACYGKKNGAHTLQLAEAAKAKGQRVISGKDAKKHTNSYSPETLAHNSAYMALDARLYSEVDSKHSGKTVEQLLGEHMPAPVLIERPDGKGFVKALPRKDVEGMLKLRGLARQVTRAGNPVNEAEKKAKREAAARWAAGEQILAAVAGGPKDVEDLAGSLQKALATHPAQASLLSHLLVHMGARMFCDLDNDSSRRVIKLLGWPLERAWNDNDGKVLAHFRTLDAQEFNRFVVAALIGSEVHAGQYTKTDMVNMVAIGNLLGLDVKTLKAKHLADAAAAEKAKAKKPAAPAKKAAGPRVKASSKETQAFMAPLHCSPALQAIVGTEPLVRTTIVSKIWAYIKKHKLQDATNKRMVNTDDKLKAVFGGKAQVSMFEMAGLIGKSVGNKPFSVATAATEKAAAAPAVRPPGTPAKEIDPIAIPVWRRLTVESAKGMLGTGARVRVANVADGLPASRAQQEGKAGTLDKANGPESWLVTFQVEGSKSTSTSAFNVTDLMIQVDTVGALKTGDKVRIRYGLRSSTGHLRKTCGRLGVVSSVVSAGRIVVKAEGERGQGNVYGPRELEIFEPDRQLDLALPALKAEAKDKPVDKAAEKNATGTLPLANGIKLAPQPAWPFPTAPGAKAGAKA